MPETQPPNRLLLGETSVTLRILSYLDSLGMSYERVEHEPVTTSEAAALARVSPLRQGAKALLVKADGAYWHLVLSAALRVDNVRLRDILGTRRIRFASGEELLERTGCLPGAVPPFGNLFGLPVLLDDALLAEETVCFNCGSHTISLRMRRADMVTACEARIERFGTAE